MKRGLLSWSKRTAARSSIGVSTSTVAAAGTTTTTTPITIASSRSVVSSTIKVPPSSALVSVSAPVISSSISNRSFSSAFEPRTYLHVESVREKQQKSFIKLYEANKEEWAEKFTYEEMEELKHRVEQLKSFDVFHEKLRELFSPERHIGIRKTRTWKYITESVDAFIKDDVKGAEKLVFGTDEEFVSAFKSNYLIDESRNYLLSKMILADLRYAAACVAIERSTGCPPLMAVFGCRRQYHYKLPSLDGTSAEYQSIVNNRVPIRAIVMCTVFQCVKEGKPMTPAWFARQLNSETDNNLKSDPRWAEVAAVISRFPEERFYDQLERQWVAFQTDEGVTKLKPKFATDFLNNKPRIYNQETLWEEKGLYYVE